MGEEGGGAGTGSGDKRHTRGRDGRVGTVMISNVYTANARRAAPPSDPTTAGTVCTGGPGAAHRDTTDKPGEWVSSGRRDDS